MVGPLDMIISKHFHVILNVTDFRMVLSTNLFSLPYPGLEIHQYQNLFSSLAVLVGARQEKTTAVVDVVVAVVEVRILTIHQPPAHLLPTVGAVVVVEVAHSLVHKRTDLKTRRLPQPSSTLHHHLQQRTSV